MSERRASKPGSFDEAAPPLVENSQTRAAWPAEASAVARRLAEGGRAATINDVRDACPPPPGFDPRVMGAVLKRRDHTDDDAA